MRAILRHKSPKQTQDNLRLRGFSPEIAGAVKALGGRKAKVISKNPKSESPRT